LLAPRLELSNGKGPLVVSAKGPLRAAVCPNSQYVTQATLEEATLEGGIRALVRRNRLAVAAELVAEPCEDALIAGATSIADIDKLMGELQTARNYLQSEGERVRRMTARDAHLAETASASVKIIAESLGTWRNAETVSHEHPALPRAYAPDTSPVDDSEPLHESNDQ
jgi:hypothetical protein